MCDSREMSIYFKHIKTSIVCLSCHEHVGNKTILVVIFFLFCDTSSHRIHVTVQLKDTICFRFIFKYLYFIFKFTNYIFVSIIS